MTTLRKLIFAALATCLSWSAFAQQISGSIRGTVADPTGAAVPGASVSAMQTETGLTRTAKTDRSGQYVILELPVGHYRLQAEGKGFQTYIQQGIILDVNETATIPVRLAVGSETEHVDVQADAQLIQNTVTSLGKTVSEREVLDLPLNGRNFSAARPAAAGSRASYPGSGRGGRIAARRPSLCGEWSAAGVEQFPDRWSQQFQRGGRRLRPQTSRGRDHRIQDPHPQRQRRIRQYSGINNQHHHPFGHEPLSRSAVGIPAE